MSESSLADLLPLWRTLRENDVTALVTPALDYVGGFEVAPLDIRFAGDGALAGSGEALRSLINGVDDDCTLHFIYRVTMDGAEDIEGYVNAHQTTDEALTEFVASRASWLREQPLRQVRLFCFFSSGDTTSLQRGVLGARMPFASLTSHSQDVHTNALKRLSTLRNSLATRMGQVGLMTRELSVREVQQLYFLLLNQRHKQSVPAIVVQDTLWDEKSIQTHGEHLREYTEAEQLLREEMIEAKGHLKQEGIFRRALTLKVLPESGTNYFNAESLLELATLDKDARPAPFGYWLSTTVYVQPQGKSRFLLNAQHALVSSLANAIPFLKDNSIAKQAADAAKQGGIASLFVELNEMSSKLVTLSVTLLLDADSLDVLNERTEAARAAFSQAGNSELLPEEISQLPAFLAMLPGSGPYQFRRKTVTSRNAADFLPVAASWRGCTKPVSLLTSPMGDIFRFDPFDKRLSPAHHGLIVADTGSGKSVTLGALTLDALASGIDAILVDNGGSWEPMTKLLGGIHMPVDIKTPMTPFRPWKEMLGVDGQIDMESVQDVVTFLELCVREEGQRGFDKLTIQLVARAVRHAYESHFRLTQDERPLMSHFREAVRVIGGQAPHADDKAICEDIYRRLGLFCGDELYGRFLDRPSTLRFDSRLITFDMAGVTKSKTTSSIAMATVMSTITTRAAARMRRTLVEVDEGHAYLGQDETAEKFLERCYRVMRKFDVAMWMISQQFGDFVKAKSGDAILGNSPIKIFLRHRSGHDVVSRYFHFSERTHRQFVNLDMRPGHYSDLLLMYGERLATVRMALHPMAYWILTTDGDDKKLILRAQEKNPKLSRLEILKHLAKQFPNGAPKGLNLHAA